MRIGLAPGASNVELVVPAGELGSAEALVEDDASAHSLAHALGDGRYVGTLDREVDIERLAREDEVPQGAADEIEMGAVLSADLLNSGQRLPCRRGQMLLQLGEELRAVGRCRHLLLERLLVLP